MPRLPLDNDVKVIEALAPGRDLDALVCEHILGWHWEEQEGGKVLLGPPVERDGYTITPAYWPEFERGLSIATQPPWNMPAVSTEYRHVGLVIDAMAAARLWWRITSPLDPASAWGDTWSAGLTPQGTSGWNGRPDYLMPGRTLMEAVCKAALLAKSCMKEDEGAAEQSGD